MSTKIYYAWRIEGLRTLKAIHVFGRHVLAPAIREMVKDNLRKCMEGSDLTGKELRQDYTKKFVFQEDTRLKQLFSPKIEMGFYPSRRGVMLIPFCEGDLHGVTVREYLNNLENCKPWRYWNNSDKPDDVSRREWRQRRDDWESLFDEPGNRCPLFGEVGLTMILHSEYQPWACQIWPREQYPEIWADVPMDPAGV